VKVLDFGVAKIIDPDYSDSIGVSMQGEVFGTPFYMAPEQFQGIGDDTRTDVYAIGCIAFELVVGRPPFVGPPMEVFHDHANLEPPPPSHERPDAGIPGELDQVILRCLEKDMDRRFQTGAELLAALQQVPGFPRDHEVARKGARAGHAAGEDGEPAVSEPGAGDGRGRGDTDDGDTYAPMIVRGYVESLTREAAEALIDAGCHDVDLIVAVAEVNELEAELERNRAERELLRQRGSEIEQQAREREAALRFSLGELRFERSRIQEEGGSPDAKIDDQIAVLNSRLDSVMSRCEAELAAITDREVALASAIAIAEDQTEARFGELLGLVRRAVPKYRNRRDVVRLAERLEQATQVLEIAHQLAEDF
jgi:hypothetical protein